jgi:DNA-directed RNA polymerase specialized sigma54-like protein
MRHHSTSFSPPSSSLADHLNWQLRLTLTRPEVHDAAEAIIGNLNDDGYLDGALEEIAAIGPWPLDVVTEALESFSSSIRPGLPPVIFGSA